MRRNPGVALLLLALSVAAATEPLGGQLARAG